MATTSIELARVITYFSAKSFGGGEYRAVCPLCGHQSLLINAGRKRAYVLRCMSCGDSAQAELARMATEAVRNTAIPLAPVTVKIRVKKEWPEAELLRRMEAAELALDSDTEAQDFLSLLSG
jgi:transcription elongation factor Elf1